MTGGNGLKREFGNQQNTKGYWLEKRVKRGNGNRTILKRIGSKKHRMDQWMAGWEEKKVDGWKWLEERGGQSARY